MVLQSLKISSYLLFIFALYDPKMCLESKSIVPDMAARAKAAIL